MKYDCGQPCKEHEHQLYDCQTYLQWQRNHFHNDLYNSHDCPPPSLFQILAVVIHDRIGNSAFVYLTDIHNLFIFQKFQPVQQVFSAVGKVTAFSICIFNPVPISSSYTYTISFSMISSTRLFTLFARRTHSI